VQGAENVQVTRGRPPQGKESHLPLNLAATIRVQQPAIVRAIVPTTAAGWRNQLSARAVGA